MASFDHLFYHADLVGLEFLAAVQALDGDITVGDAAAVGEFNAATAAALSTMQAEATVFFTTGIANDGFTQVITGFSSATPRDYFSAFRSDQFSIGTWVGIGQTSSGWGKSLRAAYNAGTTSFKAAAVTIWQWLMTFTSNSSWELPADYSPSQVAASNYGTFDPTLSLTKEIHTSNQNNLTALYDWSWPGYAAAIQSAQNPTALRTAKETLDAPQVLYDEPTPRRERTDYPALRGVSGLGLQVADATASDYASGHLTYDIVRIAVLMDVFRHTPQLYNLKDRA